MKKRMALLVLAAVCTLAGFAQADSTRWLAGRYGGYGPWSLHEGLNVNLDLAAFATWGKHASGGGFGQRLSATYVKSFDERLWAAVGAGISNTTFRGTSYRSAGIDGAIGYRFDEHWEAMVYGHLAVAGDGRRRTAMPYGMMTPYFYGGTCGMPFGPYGYYPDMNRVGAAVTYHFTPSFSLSVSVEKGWYDHSHDFPLPDRHDNPPYVP